MQRLRACKMCKSTNEMFTWMHLTRPMGICLSELMKSWAWPVQSKEPTWMLTAWTKWVLVITTVNAELIMLVVNNERGLMTRFPEIKCSLTTQWVRLRSYLIFSRCLRICRTSYLVTSWYHPCISSSLLISRKMRGKLKSQLMRLTPLSTPVDSARWVLSMTALMNKETV